MITFNKIRYKNILAVGNDFIELDLNRNKTTMILGKNGSGKTTFITALVFALYGKPYIKVNKNQLVNSITNKELLTEVEFTIGSNQYIVKRGIKPNIFEIYKNGNLIPVSSKISDYQDLLESTILKIDYKAFIQIIVLGSTNYVPFMELVAGDRRAVVEDLFDIQIFSVMNKLLKQKTDVNKSSIYDIENNIDVLEREISLTEKHIHTLESNAQEMIDEKNNSIKDFKDKIKDYANCTEVIQKQIADLLDKSKDKDESSVSVKLDKVKSYQTTISNKISDLDKDIQFLEDNDDCPTCKQELDKEFKHSEIKRKSDKKQENIEGLDKLKNIFKEVNTELNEIYDLQKRIADKNQQVRDNMNRMRSWSDSIESLLSDIESIKSKNNNIDVDCADLENKKKELESQIKNKYELIEEKEILKVSNSLLKDDGIKKNIIHQYIPIINNLVNKYLSDLDFFIQFELDEKFNETIKSRNRDVFSYSNFSEGQKSRISLALLFTWRELARIRNSAATNLLIMDEVFDGSLDDEGTRGLLKIIDDLSENTNIFVITHTPDKLHDKFHSTIEFELYKNFTRKVIN